jgi:hypothetical protein
MFKIKIYTLTMLVSFACLNQLHAAIVSVFKTDTIKNDPAVKLFAPGIVPTIALGSAAPAFTLNGKIVLIGQSASPGEISIMESHLVDKKWSTLESPSFSGKYRDLEPVFAPNGKYLVFASNRPANDGGALLERRSGVKILPGKGGNLWKVKYTKKGWSEPEALPAIINSNSAVFSPALTADGSLYFMRSDSGKAFHIYRSQMRNGQFETPVPASFTYSKYTDFDPAVSPDESFVIFSSGGRPPALHTTDLFIVFRTGKRWSEPIDLRAVLSENVNGVEPRLSPDCKTLYFTNSRNAAGADDPNGSYTWMVDISGVLKAHGVK